MPRSAPPPASPPAKASPRVSKRQEARNRWAKIAHAEREGERPASCHGGIAGAADGAVLRAARGRADWKAARPLGNHLVMRRSSRHGLHIAPQQETGPDGLASSSALRGDETHSIGRAREWGGCGLDHRRRPPLGGARPSLSGRHPAARPSVGGKDLNQDAIRTAEQVLHEHSTGHARRNDGRPVAAGGSETRPTLVGRPSVTARSDLLRLLNRQADDWFPALRKNSRLSAGRRSEGWRASKKGSRSRPLPCQRARDAQSADEESSRRIDLIVRKKNGRRMTAESGHFLGPRLRRTETVFRQTFQRRMSDRDTNR